MNIKELLIESYNINNIISVNKTEYGSGDTYIITTSEQSYLLKENCKDEDVEVYQIIIKENINLSIPNICINNRSEYLTNNSLILFEYIEGETYIRFDEHMTLKAIKKIRELNESLKLIKSKINLKVVNDWDRIRNNTYILNDLDKRIVSTNIPHELKSLISDCIIFLEDNRYVLNQENYQLIHMDLGPDNFLVKNKKIISILDFTPANNLELLSVSHFIYWNYFWYEEVFSEEKLIEYLKVYYGEEYTSQKEKLFKISIVIACLYRLIGAIFNLEKQGEIDTSKLVKRVKILQWTKEHFIS